MHTDHTDILWSHNFTQYLLEEYDYTKEKVNLI